MKWLVVKKFLKKAWAWMKAHAWAPILFLLGVIGFLLFVVTRNSAFLTAVLDAAQGARESYKKEVDLLNESHKKEAEEKSKVLEEYNKNLKVLEEEYANRNEELDSKKKKELKKLVEESYNDPDKLARELARLYGLEHG
tara:strand:+ start:3343 stop:3759 length:417 start_codon:yes stop_codon:yes gene_type:complete